MKKIAQLKLPVTSAVARNFSLIRRLHSPQPQNASSTETDKNATRQLVIFIEVNQALLSCRIRKDCCKSSGLLFTEIDASIARFGEILEKEHTLDFYYLKTWKCFDTSAPRCVNRQLATPLGSWRHSNLGQSCLARLSRLASDWQVDAHYSIIQNNLVFR